MKTKAAVALPFRFEVKEINDQERTFTGLAATWEKDLGDDVIHQGAFKRTLSNWRKSKKVHPLIDTHNYGTIRSVVGKLLSAEETDKGVEGKWQVIDGPDGDEVLRRLRGGYVDSLSIGYRPIKFDYEKDSDSTFGTVRNLRELEWRETSLVLFPMNPGAAVDLRSVKSLVEEMKGRDLDSDERSELESVRADIDALLKASPAGSASTESEAPASEEVPQSVLDAEDRLRSLTLARFGA